MSAGHEDQSPEPVPKDIPRVAFEELSKGSVEVVIEHDGQDYRLRVTRNGKLILNK